MNIFHRYTAKTLRKNRSRTFVTIIGIILSAAMITAVTTFVVSLQSFLLRTAIANDGNWHGAVNQLSRDEIEQLRSDKRVSKVAELESIGYAKLAGSKNPVKPYLYVAGIDDVFRELMPIHLTEGRMPQNSSELLIPKHVAASGGVKFRLGEQLELALGERKEQGKALIQKDPYAGNEQLSVREAHRYTVVGFYETPSFESYRAPGYTALTVSDKAAGSKSDVYIQLHNPKEIYTLLEQYGDRAGGFNMDILRFSGASNEESLNKVLGGFAAILISIIILASIALIYNAFSISISERTKQYGLLSSIGATKKQLRRSVLFEAICLSAIGVPLGLVAGVGGMGLTLRLLSNQFSYLFGQSYNASVPFRVAVSWEAIVIAAVIGVVTVLISAYLPARRAMRVSAIEAIRQSGDIRVKPGQVRTSKLTYKLFGFEGMLASKNFKRNKRKYRATVISLAMSVILFISATSFCAYLQKGANDVLEPMAFDITYQCAQRENIDSIYPMLQDIQGVSKSSKHISYSERIRANTSELSKEYLKNRELDAQAGTVLMSIPNEFDAAVIFVDDLSYRDYLQKQKLDETLYMNAENPTALYSDFIKNYYPKEGSYRTYNYLAKKPDTLTLVHFKALDDLTYIETKQDEDGKLCYRFADANNQEKLLTEDEAVQTKELKIGERVEQLPMGAELYRGSLAVLLYPESARDAVMGGLENLPQSPSSIFFAAKDHSKVFDRMFAALEAQQFTTDGLRDVARGNEANQAMLMIVNVFAYGFILLISLISVANVFNTIATNINLRRREFAMLKSIGMTQKGFNHMMNYECILYGLKSLLFGLPIALLLTYLMFMTLVNGVHMAFFIPWHGIVIAILSVFIVVFVTMLYAMRKIKKENIIDALKNENL